jgi:hypothetical protein
MFFWLREFLAQIVGTLLAPGLRGNVRGLPERDKAYLGRSYSTHVTDQVSKTVLNLGVE